MQDTITTFNAHMGTPSIRFSRSMGKLVLIYSLFVFYVSLLPLQLDPAPLLPAWYSFKQGLFVGFHFEFQPAIVPSLLLYLPLGFLCAAWLVGLSRRLIVRIVGIALSVFFSGVVAVGSEFFQQFFPPRVMSIYDMHAGWVGAALGIGCWLLLGSRLHRLALWVLAKRANSGSESRLSNAFTRRFVAVMTIPYFLGIAWLNGWFSESWQSWASAKSRLADLHFLPFYYHYSAEVPAVLLNVVFQMVLYWPLGAAVWLWRVRASNNTPSAVSPFKSGVIVGACAIIIEVGKLFLAGRLPNLTNVVVAAMTAMVIHSLLSRWFPARVQVGEVLPNDLLLLPSQDASSSSARLASDNAIPEYDIQKIA